MNGPDGGSVNERVWLTCYTSPVSWKTVGARQRYSIRSQVPWAMSAPLVFINR